MKRTPIRVLAAACLAALTVAGCGPREEIDARLQRVTLEVPFGTLTEEGK